MCLITFAFNVHSKYKLVLAANRDEFYARPTRHAQAWTDEKLPNIVAGKDLEAGGTWMGISKEGKWGALTNYRDPFNVKESAPSRGELVIGFLKGEVSPKEYLSQVSQKSKDYNGFNLLVGDEKSLYHFSNHTQQTTKIPNGVHGVSNAVLNTSWPKLDQAKKELAAIIKDDYFDKELLFNLLKRDNKPPENLLPKTGIPLEWEKAISSVFIETDSYGTRCSSILLINYDNQIEFIERRFNHLDNSVLDENIFRTGF